MTIKKILPALLGATSNENVVTVDPYWNNVTFLLKGDREENNYGLPFYRDYSKYKYKVLARNGSTENSYLTLNTNGDSNYPVFTNSTISFINSYTYFNNKQNVLLRQAELNSQSPINLSKSNVRPNYLETLQQGNDYLSNLGTGDFTIDLSFFIEDTRGQVLFSTGSLLYKGALNTTTFSNSSSNGIGLFIVGSQIIFRVSNVSYQISTTAISINIWYSVSIVRKGNQLFTYLNGSKTNTYTFNVNLNRPLVANVPITDDLHIGVENICNTTDGSFNVISSQSKIDTCLSGGISNFRITKGIARQDINTYSIQLPFKVSPSENKLDPYFEDVLFNYPIEYDLYDYSKYNAHLENNTLRRKYIDPSHGYLYLGDGNEYTTKTVSQNLNATEWTLEFYMVPFISGVPLSIDPLIVPSYSSYNLNTLLNNKYNVRTIYFTSGLDATLPLISLLSNNTKFLQISQKVIVATGDIYNYLALKLSTDGINWINVPSEANIDVVPNTGVYLLPNDEIKFNFGGTVPAGITAPDTTSNRYLAYMEPFQHFAIQRFNNTLSFFINGKLHRTISFSQALLAETTNNIKMVMGGYRPQILGTENAGTANSKAVYIDEGVKGVKLTNRAKYSTSVTNNYMDIHSIHPLPLAVNRLPQPRAKILDIARKIPNISISDIQCEWYVYINQPIDTLLLSHFVLIQTDGLTGCALISLTKLNEYEYLVKASTGTSNGKLTLSFVDDMTLKYKGLNKLISNSIGELNFEGTDGYYLINKTPPTPILTSGSNPYINGAFEVILSFEGAIANFYPERIGLVNCKIVNITQISTENVSYKLQIEPIKQDVVIIQCIEGVAETEIGIKSSISSPLTRIYSLSFPILQLPLNITTGRNDVSPNRLVFSDTGTSLVFDSTRYPIGESSSLHVIPVSEQGGLNYPNFNAVSSILSSVGTVDWTIEFYLRIDSSISPRFSHIISIDNPTSGFCIVADQANLVVRRNITNTTNLFPTIAWKNMEVTPFPAWDNVAFTLQQKFPHFALTKQGDVYRFYVNGVRVGIVQSSTLIDITKGKIRIGYYENRVTDILYRLSNVRFTLGKALYTSQQINLPALPYTVLDNILDNTTLFNYISIYSNNFNSDKATLNNEIKLKFTSIFTLTTLPVVTILGRNITVSKVENQIAGLPSNTYMASTLIQTTDPDGIIPFSIVVANEPGMPSKTFTATTNGSKVIIDKAPLTANITTLEPNNNVYLISCDIDFNEPLQSIDLSSLTCVNSVVSNLLQVSPTKYSFTLKAISNGVFSVTLEPNKVLDLSGNFNTASNILTRTASIPSYVPDQYWDNVLFLLQPTTNIVDQSSKNVAITSNNVELVNTITPDSINKSMKFNGNNSKLSFTLSESIPSTVDYTIEMFVYVQSSTVFRLSKPQTLPGNNITATTFKANWQAVTNSSSYILDASTQNNFNTFLPGYKNLNVGNALSLNIDSTKSIYTPTLQSDKYVGTNGFVAKWKYPYSTLGYVYDIALDQAFSKKLYSFTNKLTKNSYLTTKTIDNLVYFPSTSTTNSSTSADSYDLQKGIVLSGILSNANYPKLYYFLEEETVRLYKNDQYSMPAIAEQVDSMVWLHIAIVNSGKYTKLYINGKLQDKIKNTGFSTDFDVGYSIGSFQGFMTGLRITKGTARYTTDSFIVPVLPYPTS